MSLTTVDYPNKAAAYAAAADAGYDESSIVVTRDRETKHYQWSLRDFSASIAASENATVSENGLAPSGADAEPASDAISTDATVAGLDALISVVQDATASIGNTDVTPSADTPVVTDINPVLHVTGDIADAFGLTGLVGAGLVKVEPVCEGSEFTIARADGESAAATAPVEDAPVSGDLIMQLHGAMPEAAMRQFAQMFADKHMALVTLRDATTFAVVATVVPGMGGKRGVASVARGLAGGGAPARVVNRPESIIDRIRARGEWNDDEVSATNLTILNLKHRIEAASQADDLDRLTSLGSFKSTSTYYNHARAYLEWHTAQATKRVEERAARHAAEQAALDREFGYSLAAD